MAEDAAGRIVKPGLALVGEVEIAVGSEEEVVRPLESRKVIAPQQRLDLAVLGIDDHDAVLAIGNEYASIFV